MRFYDWRKGIVARTTHPYRYENPRWGRVVFIPSGTHFRTEHARRGPPEQFSVPVLILDDVHVYENNMSESQSKLYPTANFMFHSTPEAPIPAELLDDSAAVDEWFGVGSAAEVREAVPYLSKGKAISYLAQLSNKGFGRPVLLRRRGSTLEHMGIGDKWFTNASRIVKVKNAEHAIRGMKTRIRMDLEPEHEVRWFATAQRVYAKGEGEKRIKEDFAAFRQLVSAGTPCAHYLTAAGALTSPPNVDIGQFYAFLHEDQDRVLMRIQYDESLVVQDLAL